ncbi:hypothetical protein S40293_03679 [Stachybotrys chartarum IBT 40293]|nr:hypothetical protein S40293_03679 [Stachybotrys chartarum IBT 40293]
MALLVGYDSSEDEDNETSISNEAAKPAIKGAPTQQTTEGAAEKVVQPKVITATEPAQTTTIEADHGATIGPVQQSAVPLGPSLPLMDLSESIIGEREISQEPLSPYSGNRALIQSLTLPSVPNVDIPGSPPGSPPASITKKFEHFLDLKRKGTHFNAKLEQSLALKNPSIMDTMVQFDGVGDPVQYETTLSSDLWDPNAFPEWASSSQLRQTRIRIAKEKASEQTSGGRTSIDFVPALTPAGGGTSSVGILKGEKRKAGRR